MRPVRLWALTLPKTSARGGWAVGHPLPGSQQRHGSNAEKRRRHACHGGGKDRIAHVSGSSTRSRWSENWSQCPVHSCASLSAGNRTTNQFCCRHPSFCLARRRAGLPLASRSYGSQAGSAIKSRLAQAVGAAVRTSCCATTTATAAAAATASTATGMNNPRRAHFHHRMLVDLRFAVSLFSVAVALKISRNFAVP